MQDLDELVAHGLEQLRRLEAEARPLRDRCSDVTNADKERGL